MQNHSTITRRRFLVSASASASVIGSGLLTGCAFRESRAAKPGITSSGALSVADLPVGSAPAPVPFPHFPSRLHAFVWRNWSLVPVDRMATVVGAAPADILRLGQGMGLGKPPRITTEQQRRSFITVIKRNWHLVPYEQLLALLDWTPEQMAFALREDDFLFVKLGNLKPACGPLRWSASEDGAGERAHEIARIVQEEFGHDPGQAEEPLFGFLSNFSRSGGAARIKPDTNEPLRFCYSYFALYGDPFLEPDLDPYPDGLLDRLGESGVNGVWLQAVLYRLTPFPWQPELSNRHEIRLRNLTRLAKRIQARGIRLFLYLNEPRAMPLKFFDANPALKGAAEGDHAAVCTSQPEVRQYISESVAAICRAAPDLGGFFTITASENLTNCWSHGGGKGCPRCATRPPGEVIAEVNGAIQAGIQAAGGRQRLLAWDWGWRDDWVPDVIRNLPDGVSVMSVSEWSLPIERGGVKTTVGEYCLSAVGPGPRAQKHWDLARKRGVPVVAKIQAGNTWELSAIPYIPVAANTARHASNLRALGVRDIMLGWTLGGYPSPNLELVAQVMAADNPGPDFAAHALRAVAQRRFGPSYAEPMVRAWEEWSRAFQQFPFHIGVVYAAPVQNGPSNLLWAEPTGYSQSMVGFPYDDLDRWRGPYPAETFIAQLVKVADGFDDATRRLLAACGLGAGQLELTDARQRAVAAEAALAQAAAIHWRSVANQSRFVLLRRALAKAGSPEETSGLRDQMRDVLRDEIALAKKLHSLQCRDTRVGFEASNQYFYVPLDLVEKVLNCRHLLRILDTAP